MSDVASPPLPHTATGNGQTPSGCGDGTICRVEVAAEVRPLAWLAGRPEGELCFWADRDGREEIAAAGILTEVAGNTASGAAVWTERIAAHLEAADEGVRFYGGTRFDPQAPAAPEWRTLGAYRFVVPASRRFVVTAKRCWPATSGRRNGTGWPPCWTTCSDRRHPSLSGRCRSACAAMPMRPTARAGRRSCARRSPPSTIAPTR